MSNSEEAITDTAKHLRKEGHDAVAILVELGMMQTVIAFRKRCRSENLDRSEQVDALAKFFSSVIMPFAHGIPDPDHRMVVINAILSIVENHMRDAAVLTMSEGL
jgi:hypothetical protein